MVPRPLARPARSLLPTLLLGLATALVAVGCSGDEATPIDPANPPTTTTDLTGVTHQLEPTDQMRDAAAEQCLDDPTLDEGYVRAVDPETDRILAELTIDCDEVRSGG